MEGRDGGREGGREEGRKEGKKDHFYPSVGVDAAGNKVHDLSLCFG